MKKSTKWIIEAIFVVIVGVIIYYSADGSKEGEKKYYQEISEFQEGILDHLYHDDTSPIKKEEQDKIEVTFFKPDVKFKVTADVEWFGFKELVMIPTTQGRERRYLKTAKASFNLDGSDCELILLKMEMPMKRAEDVFMLSFTDMSSGDESYGGGRYINIKNLQNGQQKLEIDFNKSLNLYCAYNDDYDCALPMRENQLPVKILAGEKVPIKK